MPSSGMAALKLVSYKHLVYKPYPTLALSHIAQATTWHAASAGAAASLLTSDTALLL